MHNPPIIKPKKYAGGGAVGIGVAGSLEQNKEFFKQKREQDALKRMQRLQNASRSIPSDPILSPESIQNDLDKLTNDLKSVKKNKPVKKPLKNEKETSSFDDIEEFRDWIKINTTQDEATGEISFIQPRTGEKVPLENEPETNVLLYEVFKEQTGRKGEAAEAIKNMNIKQFQSAPDGKSIDDVRSSIEDQITHKDFISDLKKVQKDTDSGGGVLGAVGAVAGAALGSKFSPIKFSPAGAALGTVGGYALGKMLGNNDPNLDEEAVRLEANSRALMAGGSPGSFSQEIDSKRGARMSAYADDLKRQQALALQEKNQEEDRQFYAYREPGETEYRLTPTPLNQREVYELSREQGLFGKAKYEIAPAQLAQQKEKQTDEEFLRKAIAGGRVPQEISNQYFQDQFGFQAPEEEPIFRMPTSSRKIIKEQNANTKDSVFKHKGFVNVELPGIEDNLKFKVRLQEDKNGNVKYDPDVNLNPIIRDIYKAEEYSARTQGEIEAARELVNAYTVGSSQTIEDIVRSLAGLAGIDRTQVFDDNGNQILPTATVLKRWAKRFTAQNITTLLGESNRTISDADRKRADDIVSILKPTTDVADAIASLNELIEIFETPSRNANIALQSLYSLAETAPSGGYLDRVLAMEESVINQIKKSGGPFNPPKSSQFYFEETRKPGMISESIDLTMDE
tara:strand:- start:5053 stop:7095 length:2043 start_codon:yes stop_codon:yes gene_type:complete